MQQVFDPHFDGDLPFADCGFEKLRWFGHKMNSAILLLAQSRWPKAIGACFKRKKSPGS